MTTGTWPTMDFLNRVPQSSESSAISFDRGARRSESQPPVRPGVELRSIAIRPALIALVQNLQLTVNGIQLALEVCCLVD
jgi:hypothetical protein